MNKDNTLFAPRNSSPDAAAAGPILLTYLQAANLLGVSDRTVWALVKNGQLKAVRFAGRTTRIDRRDLDAFIESHKNPQPPSQIGGDIHQ